jgi:hypothetical protein
MEILSYLASIAGLICWIMILIKMFQQAGVLQGILGIICGIWAFIWGWMNVGSHGQKPVMIAWSVIIALNLVLTALSVASAASEM